MPIHGGKRLGAGRPSGSYAAHTIEASEARRVFVEKIVAEWEPIIETLLKAAKTGNVKVAQYLIDQVAGKPIETTESTEDPTFAAMREDIIDEFRAIDEQIEMRQLKENN